MIPAFSKQQRQYLADILTRARYRADRETPATWQDFVNQLLFELGHIPFTNDDLRALTDTGRD